MKNKKILIALLLMCTSLAVYATGITEAIPKNEMDAVPINQHDVGSEGKWRTTATLVDFVSPDPLNGSNGMPTSPAAPLEYGPINIAFDVDGNAIEALDEQDFIYADGYYYLIGQSFAEGAFNYAPGVPYDETLPTDIPTFYRWSGIVTYRSEDLENWTLVSRWYPQSAGTMRHIIIKKPRIAFSQATGKYVMWFLNNNRDQDESPIMVMTANSPEGPWSTPQPPIVPDGVAYTDLTHDYQIKVDPETGIGWFTQAGTFTKLYRMNAEMTGVEEDYSFEVSGSGNFLSNKIAGGMGFFHYNGWWYIIGTPICGNCVGTPLSYVMAKTPEGPWLSPDTMSDVQPLVPAQLHENIAYAQTHGAVMFPDGKGDWVPMIYGTHYRSSASGAPNPKLVYNNSGDNNLALSGQWWFTLEFAEDGRILPLEIKPTYEIPLAKPVTTEHVNAYQADLSIIKQHSVRQVWKVEPGTVIRSVLPSVFQQTPDNSPSSNKWVAQDALVNAPLNARLELPNGTTYEWIIDARTVAWGPRQVALNLPEPYNDGGQLTLTLSTDATNGGYGIALGVGPAHAKYERIELDGDTQKVFEYPGQMMYLRTSDIAASAPAIIQQPVDITVTEGTRVGFLVLAEGVGLGHQWFHNGKIVMPHGVEEGTRNESASAALRLRAVSMADAGEYSVEVFNTVGSVKSNIVTLTVTPSEESFAK